MQLRLRSWVYWYIGLEIIYGQHGGAVVSALASQQEGLRFITWRLTGALLCRVCMFPLYLCGFPPGAVNGCLFC